MSTTARPDMIGRDLEIDGKLGQRPVRSEALQSIQTGIPLQIFDARAHQRSGNAQRMRIEIGHGLDDSADDPTLRSSAGRTFQ